MELSQWLGKHVKLTRKPPNDHIIAYGILIKARLGNYEVARDEGGKSDIFKGDKIEYNGKAFIVK